MKIFKKLTYLPLFIHNISSKHDRETTVTNRKIFRNTSDGLLPILELKLKCCFCTCSIVPLNFFSFSYSLIATLEFCSVLLFFRNSCPEYS